MTTSAVATLRGAYILAASFVADTAMAQVPTDPGPRGGSPGAGAALSDLTPQEQVFFDLAKAAFSEVDGVADGLGPRFNLDSCGGCHAHPAVGGTSPAVNPQIA